MNTYPSWHDYRAALAQDRARERADADRRAVARATFCSHNRNLLQACTPCETEITGGTE